MPENKHYAKYVVSYINGKPSLVVRADSAPEIENAMNKVLPYFKRFREAVEKVEVKGQTKLDVNEGSKCKDCGAKRVLNPKTSKWFCSKKCWL
ncbi:MAG TPA: hypothetical protein ENI23_17230 [bacterium]|nr:hypothetical protein [bacterium]